MPYKPSWSEIIKEVGSSLMKNKVTSLQNKANLAKTFTGSDMGLGKMANAYDKATDFGVRKEMPEKAPFEAKTLGGADIAQAMRSTGSSGNSAGKRSAEVNQNLQENIGEFDRKYQKELAVFYPDIF